jgi:4-hydroxy-tetrahydrodipicolinate reductase
MGMAVLRLAAERGLDVTRAVGRADVPLGSLALLGPGVALEADVAALASGGFDVAVDFSSADVFPALTRAVVRAGAAFVSGTTGLSDESVQALDTASRSVPVLWEPNMSVGIHVLTHLLRQALAALGDSVDVEIVETHHKKKLDAPSGTALRLAEIVKESSRGPLVHGREGRVGVRRSREIGMHAVRGGDVVGDHSVHLLGAGERLELVHRATSRDLFAAGALRAAVWLAGRAPGRYTLDDVLASEQQG